MSQLYEYLSSVTDGIESAGAGENYKCNCVLCDDSRKRMYFRLDTDVVHCFNCDYRGNLVTLRSDLEGISTKEAYALIQQDTPPKKRIKTLKEMNKELEGPKKVSYIEYITKIYNESVMLSPQSKAMQYLLSRNVSYETAHLYRLREGRTSFSGRIIIPAVNEAGQITYLQGRDFTGRSRMKTLNPSKVSEDSVGKSDVVFGLNLVEPGGKILVSEGPFDALAYPGLGVGIFGKSISERQRSLILEKNPEEVITMLDRDAPLQTIKTAGSFAPYCKSSYILLSWVPGIKDPGEIPQELKEQILSMSIEWNYLNLKMKGLI